jgi:hypothetical protein
MRFARRQACDTGVDIVVTLTTRDGTETVVAQTKWADQRHRHTRVSEDAT